LNGCRFFGIRFSFGWLVLKILKAFPRGYEGDYPRIDALPRKRISQPGFVPVSTSEITLSSKPSSRSDPMAMTAREALFMTERTDSGIVRSRVGLLQPSLVTRQ